GALRYEDCGTCNQVFPGGNFLQSVLPNSSRRSRNAGEADGCARLPRHSASLPSKELLCKLFLFIGFDQSISKCCGLFFDARELVTIDLCLIGHQIPVDKWLLMLKQVIDNRANFSSRCGGRCSRSQFGTHPSVERTQPGVGITNPNGRHAHGVGGAINNFTCSAAENPPSADLIIGAEP